LITSVSASSDCGGGLGFTWAVRVAAACRPSGPEASGVRIDSVKTIPTMKSTSASAPTPIAALPTTPRAAVRRAGVSPRRARKRTIAAISATLIARPIRTATIIITM
jgi:hypothetical protein